MVSSATILSVYPNDEGGIKMSERIATQRVKTVFFHLRKLDCKPMHERGSVRMMIVS